MVNSSKGIGYIIEAFLALATITIFVFGSGAIDGSKTTDWERFTTEIAAKDLTYLSQDQLLEDRVKRGETGTYQTIVETISSPSIGVSGFIGLPLGGYRIGLRSNQKEVLQAQDLGSSTCSRDQLSELSSEYPIKAVKGPQRITQDKVILYILDSDPETTGGANGQRDYDTVYVDNNTECQFKPSEGPFRQEEIIKWGNSSDTSDYDHWDIQKLTTIASASEATFLKSTKLVRIRDTPQKTPNNIDSGLQFDSFRIDSSKLSTYDIILFSRSTSGVLSRLESESSKLLNYLNSGGRILLLMDLTETELEQNGFLHQSPFSWVNLQRSTGDPKFSNSDLSTRFETFFEGTGSDPSQLSLDQGGKVSSVPLSTSKKQLLYSSESYSPNRWNVTDFSMTETDPSNVDGEPSSSCYSEPGSLTEGKFTFRRNGKTYTRNIINAELGGSNSFCNNNNFRSLMIDINGNGIYESPEEGPFVSGDEYEYRNRDYVVYLSDPDGEESQLVFSGSLRPELVNYARGYGGGLARVAFESDYSVADRKLINSLILIMLPSKTEFDGQNSIDVSNQLTSAVEGEVLLPYTADLQWGKQ